MASPDESKIFPHRPTSSTSHLFGYQHDGTKRVSEWSLRRPPSHPLCRHGVNPTGPGLVAASSSLRSFPSRSLCGNPKDQWLALLLFVALLAAASGGAEAATGIKQAQCELWTIDGGRPRLLSKLLVILRFLGGRINDSLQ